MTCIEVLGGERLSGEIEIQGSKNAVLPIMAANILNKGISKINHCPKIQDVFSMIKLLEAIGSQIHWEEDALIIDTNYIDSVDLKQQYVSKVRASIILLGPLLGRMGHVSISYPGGCTIGARPIDLHLEALRKMGVFVSDELDHITCQANKLVGCTHTLRFPSVGATENIILAAILAKGSTYIQNAAKEPEIVALCDFLKGMGAKIYGEGTWEIKVEGVEGLHDTEYKVPDDRIVTGTYMTAVAGTGGKLQIKTDCMDQLEAVIYKMRKSGIKVLKKTDYLEIHGPKKLKRLKLLSTEPYPGFPTDMQAQFLSILAVSKGTSIIKENIFESRFQYARELMKLGAHIEIKDNKAYVKGVKKLYGADVVSHDLRGGAALVIAGLIAEGRTVIRKTEFIERGYEDICSDLKLLGGHIKEIH